MDKIVEWFAKNSVAANLLMAALVGLGVYAAFNQVVLQEFPDYPSRDISVTVPYRGSTPQEVEIGIVTRLEEALFDVQGIEEMRSTATASQGRVDLEIEEGYDLRLALDDIKGRVDSINTFPVDAERAQVTMPEHRERTITVMLAGDLSEMELKQLGERTRDEIIALPGISIASLKAARPYEISVEISEATLREHGLSFDDIVNAIRAHSIDLSAGRIKSEGGDIMLRTSQQAYSRAEFGGIVVLTLADGSKLTLDDIAVVTDGFEETPIISRFDGRRGIAIDVYRVGTQNIIELGTTVKDYLETLKTRVPEGITVEYWNDDSARILDRLNAMKSSAIFGFVLVVIVLSLFLRPSLAFWVALGIPIAFAGAFFILPLIGVTLNLITLFAFILVLGIVVDDAIVTGENVYQRMQGGEDSLTAAIKGTQEVAVPVIFGVLTTIVAFYPLMLMTGWRGNFFKQVPYVVIPVLLLSLVESKLILPAHLKHCRPLGKTRPEHGFLTRAQRAVARGLESFVEKRYRPLLELCLQYRYVVAALFMSLLAIFVVRVLTGHMLFTPFPRIPRDTVTATLYMPAGTAFESTKAIVDRMEIHALELKREVNERFDVEVVKHVLASSGGRPFGGGWGSTSGVAEEGEVVVELASAEESGAAYGAWDFTNELRRRIGPVPEAEQLTLAFAQSNDEVVNVQLAGPNIDELVAVSRELQRRLATFEGLYDIEDSFKRATEELELQLKPQAVHLGVTARQLASQVRQAFFGAEAQRVQRGRDDIRVMVRYPESQRKSLAALRSMMIRTADGTEVPFEEVAEVVPGRSLPSIRRFDRNRVLNVTADGDETKVDVEAIQMELEKDILPQLLMGHPSVTFSLEGRAAQTRDNNAELLRGVGFVLVAIYVLLAIPFRSYIQPFIVMSAIPFGIVGAVFGHQLMSAVYEMLGYAFNPASSLTMLSILGMLALSGVVVNDSLVMVDFINRRRAEGMPLQLAVRLAGVKRFRPILLTSLTTFVGLLPLMFENSQQAQFLIPMAISLGWGVIFATFITLFLVPVITLIVDDSQIALRWIYDRPSPEPPAGGSAEAARAAEPGV